MHATYEYLLQLLELLGYRARPIYTAVPDCMSNQWHAEKDILR